MVDRSGPYDRRCVWGRSYPLVDEEEPHKTGVRKGVEPGRDILTIFCPISRSREIVWELGSDLVRSGVEEAGVLGRESHDSRCMAEWI